MSLDRTFDFSEQPLFFASERVLSSIRAKGWNIYCSDSGTAEEVITLGPLEAGYIRPGRYVLLPHVADARSPPAVFGALEQFALRSDRQPPSVIVHGVRVPLTGFCFSEHSVKVNTPTSEMLSYRELYGVLATLTDVTNPKAL